MYPVTKTHVSKNIYLLKSQNLTFCKHVTQNIYNQFCLNPPAYQTGSFICQAMGSQAITYTNADLF